MRKSNEAGELEVDFFAGTRSVADVFMSLERHRKLVGCDVDPEVLSAAEPDVVLTLASQGLNPKSDFSESGEVGAAARIFTDEIGAHLARKQTAG